jgi:hypothetical protein
VVLDYVATLTREPAKVTEEDIRSLREACYADKEIVRPNDGDLEHTALYRAGNARLRWGVDDHTTVTVSAAASHAGRMDGDRITGGRFTGGVNRSTRLVGYGADASLVTPDYRAEMGYLTQPDRGRFGGWIWRKFEPKNGPVQWVELTASVGRAFEGFDSEVRPSRGHGFVMASIRLPGQTDLSVRATMWDTLYAGRTFEGASSSFTLRNVGLEFLTASIDGSFGNAVRFSDSTLTSQGSLSGRVALRVLRRVNLSLGAEINRLGRRGEPLDQLILYRVRTVVGFTRWLSLRFIAQGRRSASFSSEGDLGATSGGLSLSALIRIEPSPGTAVFIGWGQQFRGDRSLKTESIDLFAKASVLIRL